MSKPRLNPFLPADKQGVMQCYTCGHYDPFRTEEGYQDWVRGRCRHSGLTTVPPCHTCSAWTKRKREHKSENN